MKQPVYETMTRIIVGGFTVRVWCTSPTMKPGPDPDVLQALSPRFGQLRPLSPLEIASALNAMPQVAAYELVDASGNGGVVYTDWP